MAHCLNPKSPICLDPKSIIDAGGYHLMASRIFFILGLVFAVLGIISDAMDAILGIEPMSWFLLAIGTFVVGILPCLGWMMAVYLKFVEVKKEQ
ncbi:hypothetical protein ES703_80857 [subsurface metagenome]